MFSARDDKLRIIQLFSNRLTELKYSAPAKNFHLISSLACKILG